MSGETPDVISRLRGLDAASQIDLLNRLPFTASMISGAPRALFSDAKKLRSRLNDDPQFSLPGQTRDTSRRILDTVIARQDQLAEDKFDALMRSVALFALFGIFGLSLVVLTWANPRWVLDLSDGIVTVGEYLFSGFAAE